MTHQNILLRGNKFIIQCYKDTVSWDIYGSGLRITEEGWTKIFDLILSLPEEAFKVNKKCNWFSLGNGYSYFKINRDFIKDGTRQKFVEDLKNILLDDELIKPREDLDYSDKHLYQKSDLPIYELFQERWNELKEKYSFWLKKKKEKEGYNRFRILERDGFACKICGKHPPEVELHIDHWIPKARGGLDIEENLVTLCHKCNCSKSAQIPNNKIDFVRDR